MSDARKLPPNAYELKPGETYVPFTHGQTLTEFTLKAVVTGILLGVSKGITFWRSGAVPVVFVISAVVTGHFAIMIGMILKFRWISLTGSYWRRPGQPAVPRTEPRPVLSRIS